MRKVVVAMVALALPFVGAGPASADPARASAAAAFGLQATGLVAIGPLVPTAAAQPPDQDAPVTQVLEVPLGSLAYSGTVAATANAHRADDIAPRLAGVPAGDLGNPTTIPGGANARGVATTEGAALLFTPPVGDIDPINIALATLANATGGLLGAEAITAEAVAKCVNNVPVFETGFEIVELGGLVGAPLDDVTEGLLQVVLDLIGPDAVLSDIISITPGRVTAIPNGIAIDGLVVSVPLLDQEIVISHAEAAMPANCAVEPPAQPPTGPGPIAPTLAATGGSDLILPVAFGMLLTGFGLRRLNRRSRRENAAA